MAPYTVFSDKLWPPYTKLSDKLWTPYINFSDNRHEDFEVKVKNEGENEVFQTFHHVPRDPQVFLHHICRDKLSLDSPFKASRLNFLLADGLLDRFLDLADLISESVTLSLNLLKRWLWTGSLRSTCSLNALNTSISPWGTDSVFIEVIVSSVIVGSKADEARRVHELSNSSLVNIRLSVTAAISLLVLPLSTVSTFLLAIFSSSRSLLTSASLEELNSLRVFFQRSYLIIPFPVGFG